MHNLRSPLGTYHLQLLGLGDCLSTMIYYFFPFVIIPLVICNSPGLNLLSALKPSSVVPGTISNLNATRLTTYNACFDGSDGALPATLSDCERALDTLVKGKSLVEPHSFGYQASRLTDHLPVTAGYGSCSITLMTFDLQSRITITYAEIYSELLGPDGVMKECLGPSVPAEKAFGGQTSIGPESMLVADVSGLPLQATD